MKKIMSFIFIVSVGLCLFNCSKTDESASIKFDEKFNDTDININKTVEQAFSGHWRGICNLNINRNYLQKLRESLNDKKNGSKETGQLTKEEFFLTNFFIDDMDQQPDTITYSVYIFEWFINNNYGKSNEYTITLLNEPCIGYDAKSAIYWYAAAGANLLYSGKTQKSTIKITNANNMNNKISFMFEEKNLDIKKDWDIKFNEKKNIFQVDAFLKVEENSTFDIKFYYCDDRQEPNADIYNELKQKNKKLIADVIEYMRKLIIDKCGIEYEIDKTNKQIVINKVRENSIANNLFKTGEILVYFNEYEWIKMKDLGIDNIETFLEFSLIELFKVPRL